MARHTINEVTLPQTRLVPGWVTACRHVNYLGIINTHLDWLSLLSSAGWHNGYQFLDCIPNAMMLLQLAV